MFDFRFQKNIFVIPLVRFFAFLSFLCALFIYCMTIMMMMITSFRRSIEKVMMNRRRHFDASTIYTRIIENIVAENYRRAAHR